MEIFNENIQYENPFLCMKIFETNRTQESLGHWHFHKEVEVLAVFEGKLEIAVEDELFIMGPGDVILVGSSQLHRDRIFKDQEARYIVFQFDIQYYLEESAVSYYKSFTDPEFPLSRINYIFQENEEVRRTVSDCVKDINEESRSRRDGYELAVSLLIKTILLQIIRNDTKHLLSQRDNADLERLRPVLDYIEAHLAEKIQVEEASRIANISYYYFVKYFKKVLGMSFLEYVNYKKIKQAERYLLTKDISIAEVGEAIGMPNMAHFYKLFKKYHDCSPNEYRKKMLEWSK